MLEKKPNTFYYLNVIISYNRYFFLCTVIKKDKREIFNLAYNSNVPELEPLTVFSLTETRFQS